MRFNIPGHFSAVFVQNAFYLVHSMAMIPVVGPDFCHRVLGQNTIGNQNGKIFLTAGKLEGDMGIQQVHALVR